MRLDTALWRAIAVFRIAALVYVTILVVRNVGAYERPLSLTTMTTGRSCAAAMLFSASHAMPPVRAPSPITATTGRWSPRTA